jgi:hypothetical protein
MVLPSDFTTGVRLVGAGVQRDQFDVEIPEDLERAEEPGLIRYPPDQGRPSLFDAADFEPCYGGDESRAQRPLDLYSERSCTQFGSFRWHDSSVLQGYVGNHAHQVDLDRCETMNLALHSCCATSGLSASSKEGDRRRTPTGLAHRLDSMSVARFYLAQCTPGAEGQVTR